jgi:hypothetical protein
MTTMHVDGQPEEPPKGSDVSVRTAMALLAAFGAEIVPSRETEIPYGYICLACGLHIHAEGCRRPRALKKVVEGFRISGDGEPL